MRELAGSVRQHDTHLKLVSQTEQRASETKLKLDAIIVPASRPVQNLEQAIALARAAHCTLLVLCSRRVTPAEVRQLLARQSFHDAIVIGLPDDYQHELLEFPALASIKDDLPTACSYRITDLSTKRNLGLILARMIGWRRIFFLDDDIRDVNPADVRSTVSMLRSYPTAGMRVTDYPDNSVVCHAHRVTGGEQDVFVTGAALAVDCQETSGFFPDIYNEDWLFFYDAASAGQLGSSQSEVTQLRYNPFADPRRAAWQEFGDVLAEGLYAMLDFGIGMDYATSEYWSYFLDARQRFFDGIVRRSEVTSPTVREELLRSVEAARKCSAEISPALFERYIRLWRQDLRDWEQRVTRIRQMPSPDAALQALGLARPVNGRVVDVARPRSAVASEASPTVPLGAPNTYYLLSVQVKIGGWGGAVRGCARDDPVTFVPDLVRGGATFVEPTSHVRSSVAPASLTRRLLELPCSPSAEANLTQSNATGTDTSQPAGGIIAARLTDVRIPTRRRLAADARCVSWKKAI